MNQGKLTLRIPQKCFHPTFQMFQPLLLGLAQVYGSEKLEVGALILLAMLVASPIIFFHCLMGELVSIFTGW